MENQQTISFDNEFNIIKDALFLKKDAKESVRPKVSYHVVLLLSLTLGWTGMDRYYLGKIVTGLLKTITLGGLGIWWLVDIFLILLNKQKDVAGQELEGADEKDPTILTYLTLSGLFHYFYLGLNLLGIIRAVLIGFIIIPFIFGFFQVFVFFVLIQTIWSVFDLYLALSGKFSHDMKGIQIRHPSRRYQSIAVLFSIFCGLLGMDRFYLGHRVHGLLKLFTFGGFGIWWVLDIALIVLNILKDVDGNALIQA